MAKKLESIKDAENVEADKELLEYAARAVGKGTFWQSENPCLSSAPYWNPLTNDGDALRLAVNLKMVVAIMESSCDAFADGGPKSGDRELYSCEYIVKDPYSATRRAIVRAAAEIGKNIK